MPESLEVRKAHSEALLRVLKCRDGKVGGGRETLDLSDLRLTRLPPGLERLSALEDLSLGGNEFSVLPPEIPVAAGATAGRIP